MNTGQVVALVVLGLLLLFVVIVVVRTIRVVSQATAIIIERLGRYSRTLEAGLHLLIPFVDKARAASVQDSMEQQMRAERQRRATILTAEGVKQSQILTAEGEKQSNILRAEGTAQAAILNAQGEARAIQQVFDAIHRGNPDQKL